MVKRIWRKYFNTSYEMTNSGKFKPEVKKSILRRNAFLRKNYRYKKNKAGLIFKVYGLAVESFLISNYL